MCISIVDNGTTTGSLETDGANAGVIAYQVLSIAKITQERSNLPIPDGTKSPQAWPEVAPTEFAIGPSQKPELCCLIVACGLAKIGFALDKNALRGLGQAMFALSAQGSVQ